MTTRDERDPDILRAQPDPRVARLVADLDTAFATLPPAHVRAAMIHAIEQRMAERARAASRRPWTVVGVRVAAVAATLALALSGVLAYLSGRSATPVSAQTVLSRAVAASRLAPDQAAHLIYAFSPGIAGRGGGMAGPMDVWLQADARGATARWAATQTIYGAAGSVAAVQRGVLIGGTGQRYVYDPHANAVAISDATTQSFSLGGLDLFDPSGVAVYLAKAAQGAPGQARLLPQQTLDGVTVDVVQLPGDPQQGSPPMTAYFDAQSYLFRGADLTSGPYTLRMRVTADDTVAASAVPPQAFALDVPATAHVVPSVSVPEFTPGD